MYTKREDILMIEKHYLIAGYDERGFFFTGVYELVERRGMIIRLRQIGVRLSDGAWLLGSGDEEEFVASHFNVPLAVRRRRLENYIRNRSRIQKSE